MRSAIEGSFDDCQTIVKTLFGDLAFRDELGLSGVNSINWARILAQIVYYFTSAVALGAPRPARLLRRADRQFRRRARRLLRQAHGPAGRATDDRHQRERHPRPHAGDRPLQAARRQGDAVAVDGHPGLLEFRAAAVRRLRPRRQRGARADGGAEAGGRVLDRSAGAGGDPPRLRRRARRREGLRGRDGARLSRQRRRRRSAQRGRRPRGARGARARSGDAGRSRWRPPIRRNSPSAVERAIGRRPRAAAASRRARNRAASATRSCPTMPAAVAKFVRERARVAA